MKKIYLTEKAEQEEQFEESEKKNKFTERAREENKNKYQEL
jgi:hypothetical protein